MIEFAFTTVLKKEIKMDAFDGSLSSYVASSPHGMFFPALILSNLLSSSLLSQNVDQN